MVVDPSNYDVSELREQSKADDTPTNEEVDHGFNWVSDQEKNHGHDDNQHQNAADTSPSENHSQPSTQQPAWKNVDPNTHNVSRSQKPTRDGGERLSLQQVNAYDDWQTQKGEYDQKEEHGQNKESDPPDSEESQRERLARTGVDPINYDLGELRTVSDSECSETVEQDTEVHGFVWSDPPEQYRTRIEDPTSEQSQRLLTIAGIDPELVGEKPYLTTLPTEDARALVIDWLEFLTSEAGTEGATDALSRYCEIGWFTERVERELRTNMFWIDHHDGNGFDVFDQGDHLLSFAYVAKIASVNSEGMRFY
jgi:archaellum component FlaD/FlaE